MSPFRYRDEESSSTGTILGVLAGAVAGFAVGMIVAQRVGGFSGLTSKLRRRGAGAADATSRSPYAGAADVDEFEDVEEDEFESDDQDAGLEEHVLEAFRNDPILSERAIDIGSIGEGMIELAGWVEDEDESHHAVTIARGVPGVDTVVNRIAIGDEEERFTEAARKFADGDAASTEAHWEGQGVGTGRRRQGTSSEPDRHADPKVPLEERWLQTDDAIANAADDIDGIAAERRSRAKKSVRGDRAGGSPVSPSGVPKADHVANPLDADAGGASR
ncbi:MAG: transport-associated protein [Gemmatimonadetes bacterium]|nr:transport-associated protein [Gemmatimonadota bacterium]